MASKLNVAAIAQELIAAFQPGVVRLVMNPHYYTDPTVDLFLAIKFADGSMCALLEPGTRAVFPPNIAPVLVDPTPILLLDEKGMAKIFLPHLNDLLKSRSVKVSLPPEEELTPLITSAKPTDLSSFGQVLTRLLVRAAGNYRSDSDQLQLDEIFDEPVLRNIWEANKPHVGINWREFI